MPIDFNTVEFKSKERQEGFYALTWETIKTLEAIMCGIVDSIFEQTVKDLNKYMKDFDDDEY